LVSPPGKEPIIPEQTLYNRLSSDY